MIRILDFIFSFLGLILFSPILIILFLIGYRESRSPLFRQERIGKNMKGFNLLKFRTMHTNTQSIATHLVNPNSVTKFGKFLRKSKLDELPQLWNVLVGDMSLVGPRPNLFNQTELLEERKKLRIYDVKPGITGLAQVRKIDMSEPKKLAETDAIMIQKFSVYYYLLYILLSVIGVGSGDRIKKA
jgi:O-antigen biosynthesis protein WbqP